MAPSQRQIQQASDRLALTACFPSFAGGLYAYTTADLTRGCWFAAGSQSPLLGLAHLVIEVPASAEPYPLKQARCRIAIEDALAAVDASARRRPAAPGL